MIKFVRGDLLDADVEALVNAVNTVGVMGKGIALMFKQTFPDNYREYRAACGRDEIRIGKMFVTERVGPNPRWIVNFPTKRHWRGKSKIEWVVEGLADLRQVILERGIRSIAVPALGSGNGGLDWPDVRPRIERALANLSSTEVVVFEPFAEDIA